MSRDDYIYSCPVCWADFKDCGRPMLDHLEDVHNVREAETYAMAREAMIKGNLVDLGVRFPRMRDWTLATYPHDPAATAARDAALAWATGTNLEQPMNLYLHGGVGAGKTGLAWAILLNHIEAGHPGDFVNLRQLLADARRKMSAGENVDPLTRALAGDRDDGHILVVDDIGAERPTDWALELIGTLVEERYLRELCTLFTSNYKPADLIRRLGHQDAVIGQRIVSRIVEDCRVIRLDAADRRLEAA